MIGSRLAHFRIIAKLGEGGMGEVYRAEDEKLGREVALKILPDAFAADPERMARFEREARALASVNHPSIASVYETGSSSLEVDGERRQVHFLVLELAEGPTLAELIERGPMKVDQALGVAEQIAAALEAAHDAGVVHRDLKPANVKVRADGAVKVLDFGLAKAVAREQGPEDAVLSLSPTLTAEATGLGVILGTAAYMAPEQARGQPVDKRADIWAFGCVLWEMLTGRKAFEGDDLTLTLAEIIKSEPRWRELPATTPSSVRRMLECCLEKAPSQRLRDLGDLHLVADLRSSESPDGTVSFRRPGWIAVAALAGVAIGGGLAWQLATPRSTDGPAPIHFSVQSSPGTIFGSYGYPEMALSSDGRTLVFVASQGGVARLYRRDLGSLDVTVIPGTDGAKNPFFSPDDAHIGFVSGSTPTLTRMPLGGGPAIHIATTGQIPSATWTSRGTIVYDDGGTLWQVMDDGGEPLRLATADAGILYEGPQVLPDGRHVLVTARHPGAADPPQVAVVSLKNGRAESLLPGMSPHYLSAGYLVYWRDEAIWVAPFDAGSRQLAGSPTPMIENVGVSPFGSPFRVAREGSLAIARGSDQWVLAWMSSSGARQLAVETPGAYHDPRVSPEGDRLAVSMVGDNQDIWLFHLDRGTSDRVSEQPGPDMMPIWDASGEHLTFTAKVPSGYSLVRVATGQGAASEPEVLLHSSNEVFPVSWSPDGRYLAYIEIDLGSGTFVDIWIHELDGDSWPLQATAFLETDPEISPDGRRIAFTSDRSGTRQVYVDSFPEGGSATPVSTTTGFWPAWSRSGKKLFYRTPSHLMQVEVGQDGTFGRPEPLLEAPVLGGFLRGYDVAPDGDRFLMMLPTAGSQNQTQLEVIFNWTTQLRRRLASG